MNRFAPFKENNVSQKLLKLLIGNDNNLELRVTHISPAYSSMTERNLSVHSNKGEKIIIWRDVASPNHVKGYFILKIPSPLDVYNDDNTNQYRFDFQKHNLKLTIPDGHPNSTGVHTFTFNNREEFIKFVSMFVSILNELDEGLQMTVQKKMIEEISKELSGNNEQKVYFIKLLSMYTMSKSEIMDIQGSDPSNSSSLSKLNEKLTDARDDFYKSEFAWIEFVYQYFLVMNQDEVYKSMESYLFKEKILELEEESTSSEKLFRGGVLKDWNYLDNKLVLGGQRNNKFAQSIFRDAMGLSWIIISKQIQNILGLSSTSETIQPKNQLVIKMGTYDDAEERKEFYTKQDYTQIEFVLGTDPNLSVLKANETDLFLIITDRNYILKITAKLLLLVAMEGYVPFKNNSGEKFPIEDCGLPEHRLEIFKEFMNSYLSGKFEDYLNYKDLNKRID